MDEQITFKFHTDQPELPLTGGGRVYELRPDGTGTERMTDVVFTGEPGGNPIRMIGNGTTEFTWSATDRTITCLHRTKTDTTWAFHTRNDRPSYEFGAAGPSTSGSPLVDAEGRVVGLVSRVSPGETQSSNVAAASETLVDLLAGKGIAFGVGEHDRHCRAGLDRWFEGDYDGAVEAFDEAPAGSPGHLQAAEYRRLAVERGGTAGGTTTTPVVLALLCAGVAMATATAATAIAPPRRRAAAGASDVDTPAPGTPGLPVALGVQPQHDREGDTDEVQRREALTAGDGQTEEQPEPRREHVQPGTPLAGEPGATDAHQGRHARESGQGEGE